MRSSSRFLVLGLNPTSASQRYTETKTARLIARTARGLLVPFAPSVTLSICVYCLQLVTFSASSTSSTRSNETDDAIADTRCRSKKVDLTRTASNNRRQGEITYSTRRKQRNGLWFKGIFTAYHQQTVFALTR